MPSRAVRRQLRVLTVGTACFAIAMWGPGLWEAARGLNVFALQAADIEVAGVTLLTGEQVIDRLQLGSFASVWGDADLWRDRVAADPMVRSVEIRRRVPSGLLVTVQEREPIALAATPVLEAVDADGYRLPIDPTTHRLDLPIISVDRLPAEGSALFPEEVRALAAEVEHLTATHQEFARRISTLRWYSPGVVAVRLQKPAVDFIMPVRTNGARIREGESALGHAMSQGLGRAPAEVDLRFADQVIVRRTAERRSFPTARGR